MCQGMEQYFVVAHCWVHTGTTLLRSAQQHMHHLRRINSDTLVLVHIGTNDVASGNSADDVVKQMAFLLDSTVCVVVLSTNCILPFVLFCLVVLMISEQNILWSIVMFCWRNGVENNDNVFFFFFCEPGECMCLKEKFDVQCRWIAFKRKRERVSLLVFQAFLVSFLSFYFSHIFSVWKT